MLQAIRNKASSWVVKAMFALLVASFAIWSIGDILQDGGSRQSVAVVGGTDILLTKAERQYRQLVQQYHQILGPQFGSDQARQFGLPQQAVDQLIEDALYAVATDKAGLVFDEALIRQEIQKIPAFQDQTGRFDRDRLRQVLSQNQLSEAELPSLIRQALISRLMQAMIAAGAAPPQEMVADLYRKRAQARVVEFLTVPTANFTDIMPPDEETLAGWLANAQARFMNPERRDFSVLLAVPEDLVDSVAVTPEEIQQFYEQRQAEFQVPERRSLIVLRADDKETADKLVSAMRSGATATAAAAGAGIDPIPLESVTQDALSRSLPELSGPAFALADGAVTDPVQLPLGWYVAALTKLEPMISRQLEDVRPALEQELRLDKAADRLYSMVDRLEDALVSGAPLGDIASRFGLKVQQINGADVTGTLADGSQLPTLPGLRQILVQAFNLPSGQTGRLSETGSGGYFVVRVNAVTAARPQALDEARPQVLAAWMDEKRQQAARDLAAAIRDEIQGGASLSAVAQARSLPVTTPSAIRRDVPPPQAVPAAIVAGAFELAENALAIVDTPSGVAVIRLLRIEPPDPAEAPSEVRELSEQIGQSFGRDFVRQFGRSLRDEIPVRLHPEVIDRLAGPGLN